MIVAIYGSLTILFLFRKKTTAFIQEIPKLVKENDGVRCNGLEKKSDLKFQWIAMAKW